MAAPIEPNGSPPQQVPLSGEMVISAAQVSVGRSPNGQTLLLVQPLGTALTIVLMMAQGAGDVGRALIAQESGLIVPP